MRQVFLLTEDKISSVDAIASSVDEVWDKLQYIKSVAHTLQSHPGLSYDAIAANFGAVQANALMGCLNLIGVMAEEAQGIIESKVENGLG